MHMYKLFTSLYLHACPLIGREVHGAHEEVDVELKKLEKITNISKNFNPAAHSE